MSKPTPSRNPGIAWYNAHAASAAECYEALSFPEVHNWLLYRLPERRNTTVLDIGAGSGRDAAWLAGRGHEVVAVEPAEGLRREGQARHRHPRIRWLNDRLPDLPGKKGTEGLNINPSVPFSPFPPRLRERRLEWDHPGALSRARHAKTL